jgi:hypothetical protein
MGEGMETELEAIREAVRAADLTDETRHTVGWCLDQLPHLCREFTRTNESRFGDEIRRLGLSGLTLNPARPSRRKKAS